MSKASRMNSACVQANGVAEEVPRPPIAQRTRVKKSGIRLFEQVSGIH
jgi:hypothetical protein